jgi:hypothetical protein
MKKKITFKDLDIPNNYFDLSPQEKNEIVQEFLDAVIDVIDNSLMNPHLTTQVVAKNVLISTLQEHEVNENYEICEIIKDMINLLDE